ETRGGDKRPLLSDLRESGSIEQDADMVLFLYRPEYYGITEDENGISTKGFGEISIAKHRNGSTGTVDLKFIGHLTKFVDIDADIENQERGGHGSSGNKGYVTFKSRLNILDDKHKISGKDPRGGEAPF
ncbi:MAG: DnaB-like helicase C-terminal domain-containing protein, partial [Cyclobacteriaceae bacterium]|nr:DnaB-like helicase C-terminal domain-containing protein [Cyclobacteriaceae bacterium]